MGRKAVAVFEFINNDIDTSILETLNTRRCERLSWIRRRMDEGYYVAGAVLLGITGMMDNFYQDGTPCWRRSHASGA